MGKDNNQKKNNGGKGNRKNNQGRKQKAGPPSVRDKALLKIGPPPNPHDTTSIKLVDKDGNEEKERLPSYRDNDNAAIVLTLCEKAINPL